MFYSTPKKKRYVLIAGIFGIGFGIVLGFLKDYIDNTTSEDKDKITALLRMVINNIKGMIPFISKDEK